MADSTLQEAIRIVLETQGREGVDALRKALEGVGDVSADTVRDTDRLLDSLAGLNETAAKAARFGELSAELASTTEALDNASAAALQLNLQLGQTDKPTKEMQQAYRAVRDEVTRLQGVQAKQADAAERVGRELREQGFDTQALAGASRQLRTQIEGTTAALQKQVGAVEREAVATRKHKQALAEQDAQFRKLVQSGHASAEALRRYRADALGAAEGSRRLSGESGRLGRVFGGLRNLIAPVLGYLTFRAAVQGVKNLAAVGAAAENARRSLANLYGTQAAGNRAYEELRTLAKQNGLVFNEVLETAKKLKAFGLDPLNGSLQALIDQNAAVGGSMEDLDGKVLAVGQAWAKQKLQGEEILQLVERGVPVWDLLQKATGKNVQELQKLSSAGKLGRDTISALVAEIGKANSGAAAQGLSGLSGLIAQAQARWQDFLQKVADSGVTDYLKQQVQSLLGSTGNLDQLARRVADGVIKTLDAAKRLGQQLALVGKPVATTTLALARHADALVLLGKVYVALQLSRFAGQFLQVAKAERIATAATEAATAAEAARGVGLAKLGGLLRGLPKTIQIGLLVAGLDYTLNSFIKLNAALDYRREVLNQVAGFERLQGELQREQLRLGQQLQALYQGSADTVVQSGARIGAMTRDQAADYRFALEQARQYFGGVIRESRAAGDAQREAAATAHWKALGEALTAVKARLADLDKAAATATGFHALASKAVEKFDEIASKTGKVKEAVNGIFDGIDLTQVDGLKQAADIFDQVRIRGTAAADAVKAELRTALAHVAAKDLPALKAAADQAFAAGSEGARLFAEQVDRINLTRLGVDVDAIKTGFTETGRAAVDSFRAAADEVDKLGLTAVQKSAAIAQAFDAAFKQAGTRAELEALKQALQSALSSGDIGFAAFQQRVVQVDAKLAELGGTGQQMGDAIAAGASTAGDALAGLGDAAQSAAHETTRAGDKALETGDKAKEGAEGVKEMTFSFASMSKAANDALLAQNRLVAFQDLWRKGINEVTGEWRRQMESIQAVNAELEEQLAQFDPLTSKVKELQRQYAFVDDATLRALAEKQQRLEQERKRAEEEQARAEEQARRAREEQQRARDEAAPTSAQRTTTPSRAATPAATQGAAPVMATLRLIVQDGGAVDLVVPATQAESLLADIRRAASVSQKRKSGG